MSALPLAGRRILVTRAAHQAGKLSEGLRALGAEPVEVPVLEIRPPADFAPLDRALRRLAGLTDQSSFVKDSPSTNIPVILSDRTLSEAMGKGAEGPAVAAPVTSAGHRDPDPAETESPYDWLILTSANTVTSLVDRTEALGLQFIPASRLQVAAIGEATAAAARAAGLQVALVPENYVAESLVEELLGKATRTQDLKGCGLTPVEPAILFLPCHPERPDASAAKRKGVEGPAVEFPLAGLRFLIARAAIARDLIPDALRATGATVDVVDAYRNVMPESAPERLRAALEKGIDAATFTSSSSVTHLAAAARAAGIAFPLPGVAAISIGPITSKTLREAGWEPAAEATLSDISGLLQALLRSLE